MAGRLSDRQARIRRRLFVGRGAEIARVLGALRGSRSAPRVFYLHGLGGAGKSALLAELADRARARRVAVVRIDGRDVPATI
ncbi:MAG TPA: AAA family ATPase, partial [Labilithrix sp.]